MAQCVVDDKGQMGYNIDEVPYPFVALKEGNTGEGAIILTVTITEPLALRRVQFRTYLKTQDV